MEKVIVFGTGQMASQVYFYLTHDSPYQVVAFTADQEYIAKEEETLFELPVVPFEKIETLYPPHEYKMSIPISYVQVNRLRAERYEQAKAKGYQLVSYISSKAIVWPGLVMGDNCFFFENSIIQPFVEIGNNVLVAPGSLVGHHSVIKDHCFLAPHAVLLGYVTVEPYCFIGANSTIRDGVVIARECVISAGVSIHKDTQAGGVYVGSRPELLSRPSSNLKMRLRDS